MQNRKLAKNQGFSLIEVVLAMVILAIVAIPLFSYFTASVRSSARMEKKQKATILAQQILESIEAESKLLSLKTDAGIDPEGNPTVSQKQSVAYLTDTRGYVEESNSMGADGIGRAVYTGKEDDFDVKVEVKTEDNNVNNIEHSVISGVDDTKDLVASEGNQENEALIYFMSVNAGYADSHAGAELTDEQIRAKMSRMMHLILGWDAVTGSYTAKAYYTYQCKDLKGSGSTDSFQGTVLLDEKLADLENVYLIYRRTDHGGMNEKDEVNIENLIPTEYYRQPDLYLICQNAKSDTTYQLTLHGLGVGQNVHSNIGTNPSYGRVYNESAAMANVKKLEKVQKDVRMIEIYVTVSRDGDQLASMNATKGE